MEPSSTIPRPPALSSGPKGSTQAPNNSGLLAFWRSIISSWSGRRQWINYSPGFRLSAESQDLQTSPPPATADLATSGGGPRLARTHATVACLGRMWRVVLRITWDYATPRILSLVV